jgi:hypothetical protein
MYKYLCSLFVVVAGCASYVPINYVGSTSSTQEKIEATGINLYLQHVGAKYQHYVFDLAVVNKGKESIYLSPQEISFYYSDERFPRRELAQDTAHTISTIRLKRRMFVKKPAEVRRLFEQKERSRATVGIIFSLVSVGLVVYDEVQDARDRSRSHVTEKDVVRAATRDALVSVGFLAADLAQQSKQKAEEDTYYLSYEIFTEGNISTAEKKKGKLFLPMGEGLRYLRMVVPIGNKEYIFDFKQKGSK